MIVLHLELTTAMRLPSRDRAGPQRVEATLRWRAKFAG
jgi:hypothetical protein